MRYDARILFHFPEPPFRYNRPIQIRTSYVNARNEEAIDMATQEITRNEWRPFLDEFSKQHKGDRATVQTIGDDSGVQTEAESLPFVGISAEDKGSEKGSIVLMLGTETDDHVEHWVTDASHLWQKTADGNAGDALEIESSDGTKTILQLESEPLLE